jgi:soluble lytic murein transglycosylase
MSAARSIRSPRVVTRRRGRARLTAMLAALIAVIAGIALTAKVRPEHSMPLAEVAIIKHQAQEKHLDPALIAAVIYAETKFDPRESSAGAQGLMQILPSTAEYLAHISGGTTFTTSDLANPEVNIAYGSYYLSYLLKHYGGAELPAIAAYNAGLTNVDQWASQARAGGRQLATSEIPFPQTRAYVAKVLSAESAYTRFYGKQLGLE